MKKIGLLLLLISLAGMARTQSLQNRLLDFGFERQLIHELYVEGSEIIAIGQVLLTDTMGTRDIFHSSLNISFEPTNFISYSNDDILLSNNLLRNVVKVDDKLVGSFHAGLNEIIYEIRDDEFYFLDTLSSFFAPIHEPVAIIDFTKDINGKVWYSGVEFQPSVSGGSFTHPFITELSNPSNKHSFVNFNLSNAFGGIVPLDTSFYVVEVDRNGDLPIDENWSHQAEIREIHKDGTILQSWKSELKDGLGIIQNVFLNSDQKLVLGGYETRRSQSVPFAVPEFRPVVFQFSFEQGIEWKSYPYGEEWWDNVFSSEVNEIIPAIEQDGYIILGSDIVNDSLGEYLGGAITKINRHGDILWQKTYNSGFAAIHELKDIKIYQDGYVCAGFVWNIANHPPDLPVFPAWMMQIDNEGEIKLLTNTEEPIQSSQNQFVLKPNPVRDHISIDYQKYGFKSYVIYDLLGNTIDQQKLTSEVINTSRLSPGTYFISFFNDNAKPNTQKFIKH